MAGALGAPPSARRRARARRSLRDAAPADRVRRRSRGAGQCSGVAPQQGARVCTQTRLKRRAAGLTESTRCARWGTTNPLPRTLASSLAGALPSCGHLPRTLGRKGARSRVQDAGRRPSSSRGPAALEAGNTVSAFGRATRDAKDGAPSTHAEPCAARRGTGAAPGSACRPPHPPGTLEPRHVRREGRPALSPHNSVNAVEVKGGIYSRAPVPRAWEDIPAPPRGYGSSYLMRWGPARP